MKKRSGIWILCILIVLAVCIGLLAWLNAPDRSPDDGALTVLQDGELLRSFSMDEIYAMDYIEVEKEIVSSSHEDDIGLFRGVPLRDILTAANSGIADSAVQIVARAEDGFVTVYNAEEVFADANIFVSYAKDGRDLGTLQDGGSGPLRVILIADEFGNRSTKYLYELEVR